MLRARARCIGKLGARSRNSPTYILTTFAVREVTLRIEFYEPAMCCTTGLCGPSVDERLVHLTEDLKRLQGEEPGLVVERYAINQRPFKFRDNADVYKLVTGNGKKILPVTTVDGKVVKTRDYPSYDEMKAVLDRNEA